MKDCLLLMRHGKTVWNQEGRIQGWGNSPLLEESKAEVLRIAQKLSSLDIASIYSSPLGRCIDTAEIVCTFLDKSYEIEDLLIERRFGAFEGELLAVARAVRDTQGKMDDEQRWSFSWSGGESYEDVQGRVLRFLDKRPLMGTQLIVSHEVFNKVLLGHLLQWSKAQIMDMQLDNSTVFVLDWKEKRLGTL